MYVQSIQPRRGHKLDLSSVVAVSGGAAGLESELLRDVLLLLRPQSRAGTLGTEGTAAVRVRTVDERKPAREGRYGYHR